MGERLGVDLVANPDLLASDFTLGWKAAMLEWSALDLGRIARELGPTHEAVLKISRGINVGNVHSSAQPNGFADRKKQFEKIWKAIGGPYSGLAAKFDPAADGVLEEGEEGDAVTDLQIFLARLGYAVGEPDGVFGPRTVAAVAAFQARNSEASRANTASNGRRSSPRQRPSTMPAGRPSPQRILPRKATGSSDCCCGFVAAWWRSLRMFMKADSVSTKADTVEAS